MRTVRPGCPVPINVITLDERNLTGILATAHEHDVRSSVLFSKCSRPKSTPIVLNTDHLYHLHVCETLRVGVVPDRVINSFNDSPAVSHNGIFAIFQLLFIFSTTFITGKHQYPTVKSVYQFFTVKLYEILSNVSKNIVAKAP